jgi:hypothetical protein
MSKKPEVAAPGADSAPLAADHLRDIVERVEVWLPVCGYEGVYEVSNHGKIRRGERVLAPSTANGYLHVSLSLHGAIITHRVHVLVLTAFCGPPPFCGAQAAHNDGNQINCHLTNLRWASAVENQADVERHGHRCKGTSVYGAILDDAGVRTIRALISAGSRNRPIAERFGVSISTIHLIRHNQTWKHVQ